MTLEEIHDAISDAASSFSNQSDWWKRYAPLHGHGKHVELAKLAERLTNVNHEIDRLIELEKMEPRDVEVSRNSPVFAHVDSLSGTLAGCGIDIDAAVSDESDVVTHSCSRCAEAAAKKYASLKQKLNRTCE